MSHRTVVAMVWNPCENDTRVMKEASSLASAGYDVTVVCLAAPHLPMTEVRDGVTYKRVARAEFRVRDRADKVLKYLAIISGAAAVLVFIAAVAFGVVMADRRWIAAEHSDVTYAIAAMAFSLGGFMFGWVARFRLRRVARMLVSLVRRRLLSTLYRALTFRLVYLSMGRTVRGLEPSIVHAHDLQTLPAASRLARALSAKLVYDSHELALEVSNPPLIPWRWWMKWLERRCIRRADRVITVSDGIATLLESRYGIRRPVVVYNAPPTRIAATAGNVRSDLHLSAETPLVLYVGAPSFQRGLEVLVDAFAHLDEFHLACVGPRNADWENSLMARAEAGRAAQRIHFLDPVPVDRLASYLSSADVGVIAYQNICLNHEHCMPNKLFETVLAGVPLVVANLVDLRSFVERHQVGVAADETDPEAIAESIRTVTANKDLRPDADKLARLREEFGWEAQASKLLAIYADLDNSRGPSIKESRTHSATLPPSARR